MKSHAENTTLRAALATAATTLALLATTTTTTRAADGAWAADANGSWNAPANWTPQAIPGGIGSVITFPVAATANRTATLDAPFTLGSLAVNVGGRQWIFNSGSNGALTFDNAAAKPELLLDATTGANRIIINAPICGTNGVLIHTQTGKKPFLELHDAGAISGEVILSNSMTCIVYDSAAFGSASIAAANAVVIDFNEGLTITNEIILAGGHVYANNPQGNAGPSPVTLEGNITVAGGGTLYSGREGPAPALHINAPINGAGGITFRAGIERSPIYLNFPATITTGKAAILTGVMLHLNAPLKWEESQTFNLQGGTIFCCDTNVLDTSAAIEFSSYENSNDQTLNLNGFDQRIGGILNGAWNERPSVYSLVTSSLPATLTLDVAQNATRNMRYRFRIDGEFDILKKGLGTQQLNNPVSTNLVSRWIVEEGNLQFNAGLFSANALIDGGALTGAGTLLFRLDRAAPDAMILESGTLNIAAMPVKFEGLPDFGEYLILDATAATATFTPATTATAPFFAIENLPDDCRLRTSPDKRQVWLVRPLPGTILLIK